MQRGFSLLEIMVALVIVSITAQTVLSFSTNQVSNTSRLEERTFATLIAQNAMEELRLQPDVPIISGTLTQVSMAGREWSVEIRQETGSDIEGLRAVSVLVYKPDTQTSRFSNARDEPVFTLTGFVLARPNG